jgi:dTMP kinase
MINTGGDDVWMTCRGPLISVEGIDGTGKTTQVQLLRGWFEEHGKKAIVLKEPTGGPYGLEIARRAADGVLSPEEELRLFMLDRMEDVRFNIKPALEAGNVVIMDRYYQSNMAYQGARGLDVRKIKEENERFAPVPDLVIVLDIDPRRSLARVKNRKNLVGHFENEAYLEKVRELFLRIGGEPNAAVVDADAPVEEVHRRIVRAVEEKLPGTLN